MAIGDRVYTLQEEPATIDVYRVTRGDGRPVPSYTGSYDRESAEKTLRDREAKGQHPPYRIKRRSVSLSDWFEFTAPLSVETKGKDADV